jgi:hypothetical protein
LFTSRRRRPPFGFGLGNSGFGFVISPWASQQKATKSKKNMMAKIIWKNFIFFTKWGISWILGCELRSYI